MNDDLIATRPSPLKYSRVAMIKHNKNREIAFQHKYIFSPGEKMLIDRIP